MAIGKARENGGIKERLAGLETSVKVLFWAMGINIVLTVGHMAMTASILLR